MRMYLCACVVQDDREADEYGTEFATHERHICNWRRMAETINNHNPPIEALNIYQGEKVKYIVTFNFIAQL